MTMIFGRLVFVFPNLSIERVILFFIQPLFYISDIGIDIFYEIKYNDEEGNTNKKSNKSKKVFRNKKDYECDKNRNMNIR